MAGAYAQAAAFQQQVVQQPMQPQQQQFNGTELVMLYNYQVRKQFSEFGVTDPQKNGLNLSKMWQVCRDHNFLVQGQLILINFPSDLCYARNVFLPSYIKWRAL